LGITSSCQQQEAKGSKGFHGERGLGVWVSLTNHMPKIC
jgi:hypothetical protein